jgi:hypothetical protein
MDKDILNELKKFCGTEHYFQHWSNSFFYTDGIKFLITETNGYWLLDEIAFITLTLINQVSDHFFLIHFFVNQDRSATIEISDGNGKVYLIQKIHVTDFPILEKSINFYLCESDITYCLMLPSEY